MVLPQNNRTNRIDQNQVQVVLLAHQQDALLTRTVMLFTQRRTFDYEAEKPDNQAMCFGVM
jgi:hypothetical protein